MENINNPLKDIYYISIPDNFKNEFDDFTIDKNILLPIETNGLENWEPKDLTWESIVSAMLKILAYNRNHKDIDYYRNFVKAVRPNIIQELTDSAIFKSSENSFSLAREIFLALDGLTPGKDRNLLNLAVLNENEADWFGKKGDFQKQEELLNLAKEIYLQLLDRESVLTDTYFNGGFFFIKIRDFEKAELCLSAFIEYSDDEDKIEKAKEVLLNYKSIISNEDIFSNAYTAILNEEEPLAIEALISFLKDNENIWNGWFLLGWAYRRLSNFTEAINALETALKLNEKDVDIYNELAICYLEVGLFDKSQKALEKALQITPEDVKIISNMGILQMKQGNMDEAKKYFETVLVYDEEDSIAKLYLEKLE
ncbi:tetratricopeptide repeat protein [Thiospirochaeta perfilievii]|uniref:Tetratricopeptide repeat protein n=1 Tax=Thiospirochaeta perfilievii TaxID=252967 RepID=A0A5C1QEF1_9SPIO|nr:tetratricopeptide repeat protein [Thiospirochaeta perfilievii]QEN05758.1 tetratricopeptide repeat protein [Thiospirochaeta perfilievii]